MKKKGFLVFELIISIVYIFILLMLFIDASLNMSTLLQETYNKKSIISEKSNIYKILSTNFVTKNIEKIEKTQNGYYILYSKNINGNIQTSENNIKFNNGTLTIDFQEFKSSNNISYEQIEIIKYMKGSDYLYTELFIKGYGIDDSFEMRIYYFNEPIKTTIGIREVVL